MTFQEFIDKIRIKHLPNNQYQISIWIDNELYKVCTTSIDEKYLKMTYDNLMKLLQ